MCDKNPVEKRSRQLSLYGENNDIPIAVLFVFLYSTLYVPQTHLLRYNVFENLNQRITPLTGHLVARYVRSLAPLAPPIVFTSPLTHVAHSFMWEE